MAKKMSQATAQQTDAMCEPPGEWRCGSAFKRAKLGSDTEEDANAKHVGLLFVRQTHRDED